MEGSRCYKADPDKTDHFSKRLSPALAWWPGCKSAGQSHLGPVDSSKVQLSTMAVVFVAVGSER